MFMTNIMKYDTNQNDSSYMQSRCAVTFIFIIKVTGLRLSILIHLVIYGVKSIGPIYSLR